MVSLVSANGAKLNWTYDAFALNRVQTETQSAPNQSAISVNYSYDACGIGKLCTIDDGTQQTAFHYDGFGQLAQEIKTQDGQSFQTAYQYDNAGRLQQLRLPSQRPVTYQRDTLGRIERIDATLNGQTQIIAEQIRYRADNQIEYLRYGNGIEERRQYNGLGRLVKQTLTDSNGQTVKEQSYQYDNTGNIVKRQTQGISQFPQLTASYQYDGLDRLTKENYDIYPERNASYTFDANGNRLTRKQGQDTNEISEIYRYAQNSNRIIDKDVLRQDAPSPEPIKDIEYDAKQRIQKLFVDGKLKAEYRYDARNLRTKKSLYDVDGNVAETIYYHYDQSGMLIGESNGEGQAKRDYVYLDGVPVGQIDTDNQGQESIVYLHTDHLATPRLATNQNQIIVWRWESNAYGAISPQGSVTVNLRFPGQYFDAESGWFYNWNRYYDSGTGRYWTSDPIGLVGGLNTYGYVENNPLHFSDSFGLWSPAWTGEGGVSCLSCHNSWINPEPTPVPIPVPFDVPISDTTSDITGDENCKCLPATPENIKAVVAGSSMYTLQSHVSAPGVQEYVDKIESGQTPAPIWVDENIIVEGNHRYIAGLLCKKPAIEIPWTAPLTRKNFAIPIANIQVDTASWR